jgi:hypothetical protein
MGDFRFENMRRGYECLRRSLLLRFRRAAIVTRRSTRSAECLRMRHTGLHALEGDAWRPRTGTAKHVRSHHCPWVRVAAAPWVRNSDERQKVGKRQSRDLTEAERRRADRAEASRDRAWKVAASGGRIIRDSVNPFARGARRHASAVSAIRSSRSTPHRALWRTVPSIADPTRNLGELGATTVAVFARRSFSFGAGGE